uniref:Uncharacterized protein n=1 Tax=Romanomermis culicivorax TaxID=13658 RepID=A0A915JDA3_ROMCU
MLKSQNPAHGASAPVIYLAFSRIASHCLHRHSVQYIYLKYWRKDLILPAFSENDDNDNVDDCLPSVVELLMNGCFSVDHCCGPEDVEFSTAPLSPLTVMFADAVELVKKKEVKRLAIHSEVMYVECISCYSHGNPTGSATVRVKSVSQSKSTLCALSDLKLKISISNYNKGKQRPKERRKEYLYMKYDAHKFT